jgi:hypothetical protein
LISSELITPFVAVLTKTISNTYVFNMLFPLFVKQPFFEIRDLALEVVTHGHNGFFQIIGTLARADLIAVESHQDLGAPDIAFALARSGLPQLRHNINL